MLIETVVDYELRSFWPPLPLDQETRKIAPRTAFAVLELVKMAGLKVCHG